MNGLSAVTSAVDSRRRRARSDIRGDAVDAALGERAAAGARCARLLNRLWAMIGSKALSCSWPAFAAIVTVMSLPITSNAIWFTTSGITGLTLPGMIEEPACTAGR